MLRDYIHVSDLARAHVWDPGTDEGGFQLPRPIHTGNGKMGIHADR